MILGEGTVVVVVVVDATTLQCRFSDRFWVNGELIVPPGIQYPESSEYDEEEENEKVAWVAMAESTVP